MTTRVLVLQPVILGKGQAVSVQRSPESALAEAIGLAAAIDLEVAHSESVKVAKVTPATLMGSGTVARFKDLVQETAAELVFVDYALTPGQQRNLERAWNCKVIDRTGLILEIFGARARTKEGQLQVELAALSFQRSRLVRSWTHLERQRGGFGFIGGPGETQIELDRRMIEDKIRRLKLELETVRKNRRLQRESRQKEPYPIIALVGYTNAGKSTLFNYLTGAGVFAQDLLFATLDTTLRAIQLPSGKKAILSDTVGFISDLPTHLVAAFRATLEEVQEAAVILHVRDSAAENSDAERADVLSILSDLGIDAEQDARVIEVLNKIDLLSDDQKKAYKIRQDQQDAIVAVSALTGDGMSDLLEKIDARLIRNRETVSVDVDVTDGRALAWLYRRGQVLKRKDDVQKVRVQVALEPEDCDRFSAQFSYPLKMKKKRQKSS